MIINKELANKIKSKTLNEYGIKIDDKVKDNVFLAGAKFEDGVLKTNGGRVLSVVGTGKTVDDARENAYKNAEYVTFKDSYCRKDIGLCK